MIGLELRKIFGYFAAMPTEELLARLVKSKAPGASVVVVSDAIETGSEAASRSVLLTSEVVGWITPRGTLCW